LNHVKVALCAAGLLAVTSCKTVPQNPAAFNRQKLAVATWYGEQKIISNSGGMIGGIQSMSTEWGKELLDTAYPTDFESRLQKIIGGEWVPAEDVVKAPSYAALPEPRLKNFYYAPKGMKPMDIGDEAFPQFAQLAKDVGAEAVVGVENRWTLNTDSRGQYCSVTMKIYLIDDKGTLLYDKRTGADGRVMMDGKQLGAELVGALSPDNAKTMCKNATNAALDRFAEAWTEGKTAAASAPPPADAAPAPAAETKAEEPAKAEGEAAPAPAAAPAAQ
jgi:hypothetical protein